MKWTRETEELARADVRAISREYGRRHARALRAGDATNVTYCLAQSLRFLRALVGGPRETIPWTPTDRRERNEIRVMLGRIRR